MKAKWKSRFSDNPHTGGGSVRRSIGWHCTSYTAPPSGVEQAKKSECALRYLILERVVEKLPNRDTHREQHTIRTLCRNKTYVVQEQNVYSSCNGCTCLVCMNSSYEYTIHTLPVAPVV